jgi:Pyridoxal-dependent decarboxylase conserved domain
MSQSKKLPISLTHTKKKLVMMCLSMLMVLLVLFSVLLPLPALNSVSKSLVSRVLMRNQFYEFSHDSSGHKYGLVYPGVGWVIWRDEKQLPDHLKFELHYLGGILLIKECNFRYRGNIYSQFLTSWRTCRCSILQFYSSWVRWICRCPK